jgi:hypothetical protein
MDGTSDMAFWATKAADYLAPLFTAALLIGGGAGTVAGWIARNGTAEAEEILRAHGLSPAADQLAALRSEPRLAAGSIKFTMAAALARQDSQS